MNRIQCPTLKLFIEGERVGGCRRLFNIFDIQPFDEQHIVEMYMESGKTQNTCTYMLINAQFKSKHKHFY